MLRLPIAINAVALHNVLIVAVNHPNKPTNHTMTHQ